MALSPSKRKAFIPSVAHIDKTQDDDVSLAFMLDLVPLPQSPSPHDRQDANSHIKSSPTSVAGRVVDFDSILERGKNDYAARVTLPMSLRRRESECSDQFEAIAPPQLCRLTVQQPNPPNRPSDPVARLLLLQSDAEEDRWSFETDHDIFDGKTVSNGGHLLGP